MTPREGKGQCQKRKRADGTGRGYRVEAVGSWGCRRRGRCPQTKIGESQVPGSPGRSLPHAPAGPLCQQPAPLGRTSHARLLLLCALEAPLVHQVSLGSYKDRQISCCCRYLNRGWRARLRRRA